jgi:hypothetical protein
MVTSLEDLTMMKLCPANSSKSEESNTTWIWYYGRHFSLFLGGTGASFDLGFRRQQTIPLLAHRSEATCGNKVERHAYYTICPNVLVLHVSLGHHFDQFNMIYIFLPPVQFNRHTHSFFLPVNKIEIIYHKNCNIEYFF